MTLPNNAARRAGIPAAAWFAASSFHGSSMHARSAQLPAPTFCPACGVSLARHDEATWCPLQRPVRVADSRPRRDDLLPSSDFVTIILDHGETPRPLLTFALKGGEVVPAVLAPNQRSEVEALLTHAVAHNDQRLRYLAADALGLTRTGAEPLTPGERAAAIRTCADDLQMMRLMGVAIGGGS